MPVDLPFMKNKLTPFGKSFLVSLRLTRAASATDAAIQKENFGSGKAAQIISNKSMKDIMETVKSLGESGLLIKCVSKTIKNEAKEQKGRFLEMSLGVLATSLRGGYRMFRAVEGVTGLVVKVLNS